MPLIIVAIGIAVLLLLIIGLRFNAFIALILVAIGVGLAVGMSPEDVAKTLEKGVGGTLGSLAFILGFGAMLGSLIAESGAAQVISRRLIDGFGIKNLPWAMVLTGFIVGVPMFFSVGFLVVIPIIYSVAKETKLPLLYVGIPMISALSVTHGFLPPHPAPSTIAKFYGADIQMTLVYGLILAIPTIIIAGVMFGRTFKKFNTPFPEKLFQAKEFGPDAKLPSFGLAVFTALVPVLLMGLAAVMKMVLPENAPSLPLFNFLGDPALSLLTAVLFATWSLGVRSGKSLKSVMDMLGNSVKPIAIIMLIIAGGGAFKEILVVSGTSDYIVDLMKDMNAPPLVIAWSIAAALRIALGSATVAATTAAGIVVPLAAAGGVSPELLVLATGAGSLTCSQVNDTGFWLFKEYFNLSIVDTLKSWTIMETIVSIIGLIGVLILDVFV